MCPPTFNKALAAFLSPGNKSFPSPASLLCTQDKDNNNDEVLIITTVDALDPQNFGALPFPSGVNSC